MKQRIYLLSLEQLRRNGHTDLLVFNLRLEDQMAPKEARSGSDLFIVDNSDRDWKVLQYIHDWCELSKSIDIASAYFEIGALLALKEAWQKVDHFRILMGDEVTQRTLHAISTALGERLDESIEKEKEKNAFLHGVSAIIEAMASGKIECRVYRKDKFHAKAYITHARQEVIGSFGLIGSSNFTYPGLTENVELNIQIAGRQVNALQEWYEEYWKRAEDVTPELLKTIQRHAREFTPFEVYSRALQEFFRGHELSADNWEKTSSRMYPVLDEYQKQGYHALLKIARQHGGAFLCDGVGLGKTFIGLMLIERLLFDRKRVVLFVPKSARKPVWELALRKYLPSLGRSNIYSNLAVFNHSDLGRTGEIQDQLERVREMADAVIIDEAHHFRNPGTANSRYRRLFDLIDGPEHPKQMFLLTATPINNRLFDFLHMAELFTRRKDDYFRDIGIHSLRSHFIRMEKGVEKALSGDGEAQMEINLVEAGLVLTDDELFKRLVVQRSRAYVRQSQIQQGSSLALFPQRSDPRVVEYSIKKTYGRLLELMDKAFQKEKPLFALAIYYPLGYYKGDDSTIDPLAENRQKQVVALIRTQFLKRFESSAHAFEHSCERLLLKLLAFLTVNCLTDAEKRLFERWKRQHAEVIEYVYEHQMELFGGASGLDAATQSEIEIGEDIVPEEMLESFDVLDRSQFKTEEMINETYFDLEQIVDFLRELKKFKPQNDDKLKALIKLLKTDPVMSRHKVLIFTEFADTAHYLHDELRGEGIEGADKIDSADKRDRGEVIRRFAPYYNDSSSPQEGDREIRVLISTDVLSEGLNLQDATRLINYDIHWNPVRLMQRIGRVDRRMNAEIESHILQDHPEQKELRGDIAYYNFLPPEELDTLLRLYSRVAKKTLCISRTFGIEGKKLLTPDDDFEALRDFTHKMEGDTTPLEKLHLEYLDLLKDDPDLPAKLNGLPRRIFSGKQKPKDSTQCVFFCYAIPGPEKSVAGAATDGPIQWTEEAGVCNWYLYDVKTATITDDSSAMANLIRCTLETPRHCSLEHQTLSQIATAMEKHIKDTYLRKIQAPAGIKPILKAWMEIS